LNKRKLSLIVAVLLVPLVPFLVAGSLIEPQIQNAVADQISAGNHWRSGAAIMAGLVVDIFLPVPSSVLLTFAGRCFGSGGGAVIGWIGLTLSAGLGFYTSRWFGQPIVERFSSRQAVADIEFLNSKSGSWALVACRPLPILSEASVIYAGLSKLSGRKFWPPVMFANAVIASTYAVLGDYASRNQWFTTAVFASMVAPLIFVLIWKMRGQSQPSTRVPANRNND
jgi:uncharacterized membrane protein YdjX (TVP38/TMEM64 family)